MIRCYSFTNRYWLKQKWRTNERMNEKEICHQSLKPASKQKKSIIIITFLPIIIINFFSVERKETNIRQRKKIWPANNKRKTREGEKKKETGHTHIVYVTTTTRIMMDKKKEKLKSTFSGFIAISKKKKKMRIWEWCGQKRKKKKNSINLFHIRRHTNNVYSISSCCNHHRRPLLYQEYLILFFSFTIYMEMDSRIWMFSSIYTKIKV